MKTAHGIQVGTMRHTLRVLLAGWKAEISAAAEYRGDLVSGTVISALWLAVAAAPVALVTTHTESADGWTLDRLLFLLSIWYLMDALMWVILLPNVTQWSQAVQTGTLDAVLLQPVNSLIMCSLRAINVRDLPKVLLAGGLAIAAVVIGGSPTSGAAVLATAVAVVAGACLMWAFAVLVNYKSLTHVQFEGMFVLDAAHNLARVPTTLYGPVIRFVLTLLPVTFITTVPAEIFFGVTAPWFAIVSVAVAAVVVFFTFRLWKHELKGYVGAMT